MRLVLVLVVLGGCFPPAPVYRVQRAARVPRPTVPLRTGQPLSGPIELTIGASSVGNTTRPRAGNENDSRMKSALEIPDHQVRGELRLRIFERGELALIHERAIGHATKIDETQAETDSGQPWGGGAAYRYSIHPGDALWSVGLDFEVMRWSVPFAEERVCVENCEDVDDYQSIRSTSGEMTWGFGITPAYRLGNVSLFGGMFLRNHPTIVRKGTELSEYNDEDTEAGPVNVLFHAGAAVKLGAFTALLLVHQNMDRDPVAYGPGIGFAVSASIDPGALSTRDAKIDEAHARMRRARAVREARGAR
jgi:hypothetical protein